MKEGSHRILLHLNKAFATSKWLGHFRDPKVHHLAESTSDHCILTITDFPPQIYKGKHRFHFEAMWAKRIDCREIVESDWSSGTLFTTPDDIASNLRDVPLL